MIEIPEVKSSPPILEHHRAVSELGLAELGGYSKISNTSSPATFSKSLGSGGDTTSIPAPETVVRWSPYLESLFQELVARRAARKLTTDQHKRLARLRNLRQKFKNPVPADLILRDFRERELREEAMKAIEAYVSYSKGSTYFPKT